MSSAQYERPRPVRGKNRFKRFSPTVILHHPGMPDVVFGGMGCRLEDTRPKTEGLSIELGNLKIALRGGGLHGRPPKEGGGGGWRNGVPCRALCFV